MRYFLHPGLGGGIVTDLEGDAFPVILGRPCFLCYSGEFPVSKIPIFARNLKIGDICEIALVVNSAIVRETKAKKPYLAMDFFDGYEKIISWKNNVERP